MPVIKRSLLFIGHKAEKHLSVSFNEAVNLSCIHPDYINEITNKHSLGRIRRIAIGNNKHYLEIKEVVVLDFYIDDILLSDEFFIVPGLNEMVVIGSSTLRKWRIKLNFEDDVVEVDPKVAKLQLI